MSEWVNWWFNITINDISVIHMTAHRCAGGLKNKLDLRSGFQHHRHLVGVRECPSWYSIVGATVTVHQFFCILHLKCYKNEHSFEICHWAWSSKLSCKILRRYDQPFSRKWRLKLLFLVAFRIFPNGNCHFLPVVWKAGCDVARLYVLQSYRSCTFCKRKTRGETRFWIELAAPFTLAIHNNMNSWYCRRALSKWAHIPNMKVLSLRIEKLWLII